MLYAFMRGLMRFLTNTFLVGGLFHVVGAENVPTTGALIVCPNHSATLDPPQPTFPCDGERACRPRRTRRKTSP